MSRSDAGEGNESACISQARDCTQSCKVQLRRRWLHLSRAWLLSVTCCNFTICRFHTPAERFTLRTLQFIEQAASSFPRFPRRAPLTGFGFIVKMYFVAENRPRASNNVPRYVVARLNAIQIPRLHRTSVFRIEKERER